MVNSEDKISGSQFYQYFACPHWIYFDKFGDKSKKQRLNRFAQMLLEAGIIHEEKMIKPLALSKVVSGSFKKRATETLKLMKSGVPAIYHGALIGKQMIGEPDILEKRNDRLSKFGTHYYVAVDIKNSEKISDAHRFQLILYSQILEELQGVSPEEGYIINSSGERIGFKLADHLAGFERVVNEISLILAGNIPLPHVSSGCKQSPWFLECIHLAEAKDDIALLYNVKKRVLESLRTAGVNTVGAVAKTSPEVLAMLVPDVSVKTLTRLVLQAESLKTNKFIVRRPCQFSPTQNELFFDIEGDPIRDFEYLFGFLVRHNNARNYKYFLAESPQLERQMWLEFLDWLKTWSDNYVVYHYGTYETAKVNALERRYGGSAELLKFKAAMVDLNEMVKEQIVFPLYFYGLKDIGNYIGFKRSKKIKSGGESVSFYEDWLTKQDRKKLEAVILYNEDDVLATAALKDWLQANCL